MKQSYLCLLFGFALPLFGQGEQYHQNTRVALEQARQGSQIASETLALTADQPQPLIGLPSDRPVLIFGEWATGTLRAAYDANGDGIADTMTVFFRQQDAAFGEIVKLRDRDNTVIASDLRGRLFRLTDRNNFGVADKGELEFAGLGQGDALLVPSPTSVWLGNLGTPQVLQYNFEGAGDRISIAHVGKLPVLGRGSVGFTHDSRGHLYSLDLQNQVVWRVPYTLTGYDWGRAQIVASYPRLVAIAADEQDNIFLLSAGGTPTFPTPTPGPEPPKIEPSRLLVFRDNFASTPQRVSVIAEGGWLDVDYSAANGLVARKGEIYVISLDRSDPQGRVSRQILRYRLGVQGVEVFLPSWMLGENAFIAGLALLN